MLDPENIECVYRNIANDSSFAHIPYMKARLFLLYRLDHYVGTLFNVTNALPTQEMYVDRVHTVKINLSCHHVNLRNPHNFVASANLRCSWWLEAHICSIRIFASIIKISKMQRVQCEFQSWNAKGIDYFLQCIKWQGLNIDQYLQTWTNLIFHKAYFLLKDLSHCYSLSTLHVIKLH